MRVAYCDLHGLYTPVNVYVVDGKLPAVVGVNVQVEVTPVVTAAAEGVYPAGNPPSRRDPAWLQLVIATPLAALRLCVA